MDESHYYTFLRVVNILGNRLDKDDKKNRCTSFSPNNIKTLK